MKICYIADQSSIHTRRWIEYFSKLGHETFLIPHSEENVQIESVNILDELPKLSYKSFNFFSTIRKAKSIIKKLRPDILHAHFVEQFGWLAALMDWHPFILTAWGSDILKLPHESKFGVGKKFTQYALKKADMLTAISGDLKKRMIYLGAKKENIDIIHWGVDLNKFNPDINISELKQNLNINNSPVIYSNRKFETNFNISVIIQALSLVLKRIPNAILLLQNPEEKSEKDIKQMIHNLGLHNSVRIIPRFEYPDIPALYAVADIYVTVPSYDAACISLTEAMACGSIPVISEVPGPMEWVRDGYNGKVVPVKNPEALASAICNLIKNREIRELFKTRNIELIRKRADQNYWMNKMNNIYKNLYYNYHS